VGFTREYTEELLKLAERNGEAKDERATVTYQKYVKHSVSPQYEVHRPTSAHGFGSFNYLDDLHPVECEMCFCRHYLHRIGTGTLKGELPSMCRCGHLCMRHRFRVVRDTLEVCKAPETWFTEDMRTFNALAGWL